MQHSQYLDKLGEVRSRTQAGLAIFRDGQSFNDFKGFPGLTTGLQLDGHHKRIHGLAASSTTSVANPARPPVVAITPSARRATQDQESPVSVGQPLGQEKEQHPPPSAYVSRSSGRPLVVVRLCESAPGPALGDPEPGHVAVHGRFIRKLGSVLSGRRGEWRFITSGTLNDTPHHFSWVPDKSSYRKTSNGNYP